MLLCAFQHTATSAYLVEIGVIGSIGCIRAPSDFAVTPRISCVGVMATDAYIFFKAIPHRKVGAILPEVI